ncbi:MAG: aminotransferase class III-fold pyridoxal phosphate-dependent enzyme, partial [Myxococcota bacterium]
ISGWACPSRFGPKPLRHAHPEINAAVARQLQDGFEIGPQSHLAGETAELVCELTGMERVSFVCTGSEAVAAAMRCVRTFTRRDRIVFFRGDYHGNFDEVLVRGLNGNGVLRTQPSAPGIPKSNVNDVIELEYGNPNSLEILREIQETVAGVMVEPVQSRRPEFQPRAFLQELRAICDASGAQLIFDEVVTGFRCHPGGAQAVFGVKADLATYGKAVAGNLPIGIVAGRAAVMDTFDGGDWRYGDDSSPDAPVTFFAGTFVRHPLSIAACHAMLKLLQAEGPKLQETLAERASSFAGEINRVFQERDLPFELPHFTSVMYLRNRDWSELGSLLWYQLRHRGVFVLEGFPSYITLAHTESVLEDAKQAFVASLDAMLEAGFLPKARALNREIGERVFDAKRPPVPGARLGRDRRGRPAWFIADANDPKACFASSRTLSVWANVM